jgi:hypothetical protein
VIFFAFPAQILIIPKHLIVIPRIVYRSPVLRGKRRLTILKKNRGMPDCF